MNKQVCHPQKIYSQLHRIEGQIRAIEKMYGEKREVEEVVRVVMAARASLDSVTRLLITDKVNGCYQSGGKSKKKELNKLIEILFKTS